MNPRYNFIFCPSRGFGTSCMFSKNREGHEKEWLPETLFVFVVPWPPGISLSMQHSTCEIDGILLFKGARTLSSWNKMLREGRNARSVKGVVGAPLFVKFVTSRGVLRKAPSWKILLVGKSLQFTWILNILWFANLYVFKNKLPAVDF